jgi:hypothetical protein
MMHFIQAGCRASRARDTILALSAVFLICFLVAGESRPEDAPALKGLDPVIQGLTEGPADRERLVKVLTAPADASGDLTLRGVLRQSLDAAAQMDQCISGMQSIREAGGAPTEEQAISRLFAMRKYQEALERLAAISLSDEDDPLRWLLVARTQVRLLQSWPLPSRLAPLDDPAWEFLDNLQVAAAKHWQELFGKWLKFVESLRASHVSDSDRGAQRKWMSAFEEYAEVVLSLRQALEKRASQLRDASGAENEEARKDADVLFTRLHDWLSLSSLSRTVGHLPREAWRTELLNERINFTKPRPVELGPEPADSALLAKSRDAALPKYPLRDIRILVPWPYALAEHLGLGSLHAFYEHIGYDIDQAAHPQLMVTPRFTAQIRFTFKSDTAAGFRRPPLTAVRTEFRTSPIPLDKQKLEDLGRNLGRNVETARLIEAAWKPKSNPHLLEERWFCDVRARYAQAVSPVDAAVAIKGWGSAGSLPTSGVLQSLSTPPGGPIVADEIIDVIREALQGALERSADKLRKEAQAPEAGRDSELGRAYAAALRAANRLHDAMPDADMSPEDESVSGLPNLLDQFLHDETAAAIVHYSALLPKGRTIGPWHHRHPFPSSPRPGLLSWKGWAECLVREHDAGQKHFDQFASRVINHWDKYALTLRQLEQVGADLFGDDVLDVWSGHKFQDRPLTKRTLNGVTRLRVRDAGADVNAIIAKAIRASGGHAKLAKLKAQTSKGKVTIIDRSLSPGTVLGGWSLTSLHIGKIEELLDINPDLIPDNLEHIDLDRILNKWAIDPNEYPKKRAIGGGGVSKKQTIDPDWFPKPNPPMIGTCEWAIQLPTKMRSDIAFGGRVEKPLKRNTIGGPTVINDVTIDSVHVINGEKLWMKNDSETRALGDLSMKNDGKTRAVEVDDKLELSEAKQEMYYEWVKSLVPLREKGFELSPLGEVKVDGKPAVGVRVSHKGHRDINMFFDKDKGLLVKTETAVLVSIRDENWRKRLPGLDFIKGEKRQETLYGGYKEVNGVQRAMKISIYRDGEKEIDIEITEIEVKEKLDDAVFAKP